MKYIALSIAILLAVFYQNIMNAQSDFIEPLSESSFLSQGALSDLYYKQVNDSRNLHVTPIRLNNLWDFQSFGELRFNLPGIETPIRAVVNMPKRFSLTDYIWTGDIIDEANQIIGHVNFVQKRSKKFGSINIGNRYFIIKDLNTIYQDDQLLVEVDIEALSNACIVGEFVNEIANGHGTTTEDPVFFGPTGGGGEERCEAVITILVLYTQEVIDAGFDPEQLAELGVIDLNTALSESNIPDVSVSAELVGVEIWNDYEENSDAIEAVNDLAISVTADSQLRDNLNADLVILFQDKDITAVNPSNGQLVDLEGIAITVNEMESATDTLDYNMAFSVIEAAGSSQTFAHEVGHLLGCRHLKGNDFHEFANARIFCASPTIVGGVVTCKNGAIKSTIMNGDSDSIEIAPRVLRFSNPEGEYNGQTTGSPVHNNAQAISWSACVVSLFGGRVDGGFEDPAFNAFASGPTNVSYASEGYYLYSSYYWGCLDGEVHYCWEISWDYGATYQNLSTDEDAILYRDEVHPYMPVGYIRLTAICSEEPDTSISFIELKNWSAYNLEISPDDIRVPPEKLNDSVSQKIIKNHDIDINTISHSDELVYPNPANDRLFLTAEARNNMGALDVVLLSTQGISYGLKNLGESYELSNVPPGFYLVVVMSRDSNFYSPLIIVR